MNENEGGRRMKSIEKLRKWIKATYADGFGPMGTNLDELRHVADEIEAEIERDYMRLPVDANGVPIKHGDTIACAGLSIGPIDVISIGAEGDWVVWHDGNSWELTGDEVHVQPRTLEDVLASYRFDAQNIYEDPMLNGNQRVDELEALDDKVADEIRVLLGSDGEC